MDMPGQAEVAMRQQQGLTDTLQRVLDAGEEQVRVGDVVEALQSRGFGPLILAPALLVLLPTGAVPGVPSLMAVLIVLVAVQRLLGRRHPWLPQRLRAFGIERARFQRGVERLRPHTERIDRYTDARLAWLTRDTGTRLSAALCVLLAVSMPPLELVPFAAALPALAIALFALGLAASDGLLVAIGYLGVPAVGWVLITRLL